MGRGSSEPCYCEDLDAQRCGQDDPTAAAAGQNTALFREQRLHGEVAALTAASRRLQALVDSHAAGDAATAATAAGKKKPPAVLPRSATQPVLSRSFVSRSSAASARRWSVCHHVRTWPPVTDADQSLLAVCARTRLKGWALCMACALLSQPLSPPPTGRGHCGARSELPRGVGPFRHSTISDPPRCPAMIRMPQHPGRGGRTVVRDLAGCAVAEPPRRPP